MPKLTTREMIEAAIAERKKSHRDEFPGLTANWLALQISKALGRKEPYKGNTVQHMYLHGTGLRPDVVDAFEKVLRLPHGWISRGILTEPIPILDRHAYTIDAPGVQNRIVPVYRGGSATVWVRSASATETLEVYEFPGQDYEFVKIADGSLSPYRASQILIFRKIAPDDDIEGVMVLVVNNDDPDKCAIRTYDSAANAGAGAFVDLNGNHDPLPCSSWQATMMACSVYARHGLRIPPSIAKKP